MGSNRAMELFQELTKVEARRDELRNELGGLLGFSVSASPTAVSVASAKAKPGPVQKAPKASKVANQRIVKVKGDDGSEKIQSSLKQLVQEIVAKHPDGVELREITTEVTGMVERKEYVTKAKSITAVVSQAINQLQNDKAIVGEKSPETKRNKYKTAVAA